ncbi:class I adenylate-forming enzyme family protein [Pseudoclavibacter terrae]|uniref:class I adenylate-forming enzyme family protein n=1 Tax=Pseudoclavibacter terrae TaxID=1530195 RepID=UPI00232B6AE6|nr:long-chain fatty acid--CoA ligase [Pseudoclavibacter terrae]
MPITRTLIDTADRWPTRTALAGDGERFTYGELSSSCAQVRAGVETLLGSSEPAASGASAAETGGVPIVALSLSRAIDAARLLTGVISFRGVAAVLDPLWPLEHRLEILRRVEPALVVTDDPEFAEQLDAAAWGGTVTSLASFDLAAAEALARRGEAAPGPEVRPRDEPFLLLFTSGTTDLPKGFLRTRGSWAHNVDISRRYLGTADGRSTIAPGPLSYSLTLYALVEVLGTGGSLHLQSTFDARAVARTIAEERIERFVGVPAMLPALLQAARRTELSLDSLVEVITGGANQPAHIRSGFEEAVPTAHLRSYYGASEIGFIGYSDEGDGTNLAPFAGVEVSVRDDAGADVPAGETGTLHIRVGSAVERYLAATSADRITDTEGWASVNDLASFADGRIQLLGRAGDVAVSGGHKVSLPQVERTLASLPGCEQCCAVALPDDTLGSLVAVVIEGDADALPSKARMLGHLRARLAPQFVPHRLYRASLLPRTAGGKIRRSAVLDLVTAGDAERL